MKIREIYEKYEIMPNLQDHMLRVASVASLICDHFQKPIDTHLIITSTLLHDIGNMAKFKLEAFPEFLEPKGLNYWRQVQEKFFKKYGKDDYKATYKILKEIGVDQKVFDHIKSVEFRKSPKVAKNGSFEKKICQYADLRVAPFGILPLEERLSEVRNRYMRNKNINDDQFDNLVESMAKIEEQIFANTNIKTSYITDTEVKSLLGSLRSFEINH